MVEIPGKKASDELSISGSKEAAFTLPNVQTQEALARFAGNEERYRHWLIEFVSHGPAAADQIRQTFTNGTQEATIKLVHALKGRTGMLGMTELHSICLTLEMTLRNGEPASFWLEELERSADEMSKEISTVLGRPLD